MQPSRSGDDFGTARMIERQMLLANARDKAAHANVAEPTNLRYRFITISRDKGSLGDEIARLLGQRMGWLVYDKEILDYIARNSHVRQGLVEQLDEKAQNTVHETIQRFLRMTEGGSFGIAEYYEALVKSLAYLSTKGAAILIGRGANFVMRGENRGLHLRIIASSRIRIERLSLRWRIPEVEARWRMEELDTQRRNFIRQHFKHNIDDPTFYDFIFNTDHLTPQQVVDAITPAVQLPLQSSELQPLVAGSITASSLNRRSA